MPEVAEVQKKSWFHRALPGITLMLMAALITELLPGATRISSAIFFPIETIIWGGGAVLARFFVRRYRLGWFNLLLLALALAVAEECLIQQTSFAPLIIKLKGVEYARAYGFNYVYFVWAMLYEALFAVLVPVGLTELIFRGRKDQPWLSGWGIGIICVLFLPACFVAWFGWNQIARTKVFHLPAYNIPPDLAIAGAVALAVLLLAALGPVRRAFAGAAKPMTPPHPVVLFVLGVLVAVVIFGIEILAFGIAPQVPPLAPVAAGIVLALVLIMTVPGFMAHEKWGNWHAIGALYGVTLGNFAIMFVAFNGAAPVDLYGKIILDAIAVLLMLWLMLARGGKRG
ncbi:hypothetical protein [Asticcacaulis solisilvae]|uniref:hypothetical protein n=1 Tax=Asticcacaulis solisilvae TaxID=1217274 RepID=UPI003FD83693